MSTQNLLLIVGLFVATLFGTAGGYLLAVRYEESRAAKQAGQPHLNSRVFNLFSTASTADFKNSCYQCIFGRRPERAENAPVKACDVVSNAS